MRYVQGKMNCVPDALKRLPADIKTSEIHEYQPPKNLKDEEFILAINKPTQNFDTGELTTNCKEETNGWTA